MLFWLRFVLSMALGLVWGVLPLLGATGHVSYLLLTSAIVYVYVHRYLGLNDQDFDGPMGLLGEGFMPSYGIFMVNSGAEFSPASLSFLLPLPPMISF